MGVFAVPALVVEVWRDGRVVRRSDEFALQDLLERVARHSWNLYNKNNSIDIKGMHIRMK